MMTALLSAVGFLGDWWDWIAGGLGLASAAAGALLPRWWKAAAIATALAVVGIYVGVLKVSQANLRATVAHQMVDLVTVGAARDQEKATAEANLAHIATLKAQLAAEATNRERERQALRSAITSRDQILDEVRREKTARDPMPDAWVPTFRRVQ